MPSISLYNTSPILTPRLMTQLMLLRMSLMTEMWTMELMGPWKMWRRMEGRGKAMVAIKEEIVVDLASDEDEDNGGDNKNQISREKSISEAYLRAARMPLINVSLVTTKGESENERERAIVRLERLSKREIDRHLKRSRRRGDISEEEEEDDVEVVEEQVFGHENNLKDFKDLIRSEEDPGTARERRGHQQQLRRRKSFASYRNDTTFALGAGGRQPSPLNLEPLKQGCH